MTIEFYQRVRAGYLEMVKQEPNRWVVINAGRGMGVRAGGVEEGD